MSSFIDFCLSKALFIDRWSGHIMAAPVASACKNPVLQGWAVEERRQNEL